VEWSKLIETNISIISIRTMHTCCRISTFYPIHLFKSSFVL